MDEITFNNILYLTQQILKYSTSNQYKNINEIFYFLVLSFLNPMWTAHSRCISIQTSHDNHAWTDDVALPYSEWTDRQMMSREYQSHLKVWSRVLRPHSFRDWCFQMSLSE